MFPRRRLDGDRVCSAAMMSFADLLLAAATLPAAHAGLDMGEHAAHARPRKRKRKRLAC